MTVDEVAFWSVTGQKLATYNITGDPSIVYSAPTPAVTAALVTYYSYFGGKLFGNSSLAPTYITADRLGSIGRFYPWGQERNPTTNGTEKFTGYFRDSETQLDYAMNRYHQPGMGRFLSADPYQASAGPSDPGSWNRYAYTRGDPVNRIDVTGLDDDAVAEGVGLGEEYDFYDGSETEGGADQGGNPTFSITVTAPTGIPPTGTDPNGNPIFSTTVNGACSAGTIENQNGGCVSLQTGCPVGQYPQAPSIWNLSPFPQPSTCGDSTIPVNTTITAPPPGPKPITTTPPSVSTCASNSDYYLAARGVPGNYDSAGGNTARQLFVPTQRSRNGGNGAVTDPTVGRRSDPRVQGFVFVTSWLGSFFQCLSYKP